MLAALFFCTDLEAGHVRLSHFAMLSSRQHVSLSVSTTHEAPAHSTVAASLLSEKSVPHARVSQVALASQQVVRSALLLAAAAHAAPAHVRLAAVDFCTKPDPHAMEVQAAWASQQVERSALLLAVALHEAPAHERLAALDFCTKPDPHVMVSQVAAASQVVALPVESSPAALVLPAAQAWHAPEPSA
jgi:hypothetical protein